MNFLLIMGICVLIVLILYMILFATYSGDIYHVQFPNPSPSKKSESLEKYNNSIFKRCGNCNRLMNRKCMCKIKR